MDALPEIPPGAKEGPRGKLATNIVRHRFPDLAPLVDRMDRSLDRLYRLNQAFSVYESQLEWTDDDVSPDPGTLVDR